GFHGVTGISLAVCGTIDDQRRIGGGATAVAWVQRGGTGRLFLHYRLLAVLTSMLGGILLGMLARLLLVEEHLFLGVGGHVGRGILAGGLVGQILLVVRLFHLPQPGDHALHLLGERHLWRLDLGVGGGN